MSAVEIETNDADIEAHATAILVEARGGTSIKIQFSPSPMTGKPWAFDAYDDDTRIRLSFEHAEEAVRAAARYLRLGLDLLKAQAEAEALVERFFDEFGQREVS